MNYRDKHPIELFERYLALHEVASLREQLGITDTSDAPFLIRDREYRREWGTAIHMRLDTFAGATETLIADIFRAILGLAFDGEDNVPDLRYQPIGSPPALLQAATLLRTYEFLALREDDESGALRWRGPTPWRDKPQE